MGIGDWGLGKVGIVAFVMEREEMRSLVCNRCLKTPVAAVAPLLILENWNVPLCNSSTNSRTT
ncbi:MULTISPECIES: hypothetical protein [unclassified Tolypothrix]|uniref:hypothetical protein n=1 Tax=unclassified Tolypothrix TaxID=2649714 RepID=UPI00143A8F7E|nr:MULTISPECIES: hypothetical protein [unclassified Tolypothrix]UYD37191.1 hypothetical protein HG267_16550 [Tolypothrix sp. PCC 7601]